MPTHKLLSYLLIGAIGASKVTAAWEAHVVAVAPVTTDVSAWNEYVSNMKNASSNLAENEKVITFIRHGEAVHNVAYKADPDAWNNGGYKDPKYIDTHLTPKGQHDSLALGEALHHYFNNDLPFDYYITSPLSRCLQIAEFVLKRKNDGIQVHANDLCRETLGVNTCDQRKSRSELEPSYPWVTFDQLRSDKDVMWLPNERETPEGLKNRTTEFMNFMFDSVHDQRVVVVSHRDFISASLELLAIPYNYVQNLAVISMKVKESSASTKEAPQQY